MTILDIFKIIQVVIDFYLFLVIVCTIWNWKNDFESIALVYRYNMFELNNKMISDAELIDYNDALIIYNSFVLFFSTSPLDFIKPQYREKLKPFVVKK